MTECDPISLSGNIQAAHCERLLTQQMLTGAETRSVQRLVVDASQLRESENE